MIRKWLVGIFAEILKEAEKHNNPPKKVRTKEEIFNETFPIHLRTAKLKIVKVEGNVVTFKNELIDHVITAEVGGEVRLQWHVEGIE